MKSDARVTAPRLLPDWLLSRGRAWVTNHEIEELLGVSPQEASRIAGRWHARALAFSPAKGLQVLIPPQYRTWGALPAEQFVDPMMRHLDHPYYVGYLSAAELHGASHQRPQRFQVVTDVKVRDKQFGRVRIAFSVSSSVSERPRLSINTPTGTLEVATIETTVLDLVARPRLGGGTSNVATIIGELIDAGKIEVTALEPLADHYPAAVLRRAGWLIEYMANEVGSTIDLGPLLTRVNRSAEPVLLVASAPTRGRIDPRWNVYVNDDVEHDL